MAEDNGVRELTENEIKGREVKKLLQKIQDAFTEESTLRIRLFNNPNYLKKHNSRTAVQTGDAIEDSQSNIIPFRPKK